MTSEGTKTVHQTQHIVALLQSHVQPTGWITDLTVEEMGHQTGLDLHDVRKTLWNLQKRGYLKFNESHPRGSASRTLTALRMTKAGNRLLADQALAAEAEALAGPEPPQDPIRGYKTYPVVMATDSGFPSTLEPILVPVEEIDSTKTFFAVEYPLITSLVDRGEKVQEAARLLESAGLEDLAAEALIKGDTYTPLEAEIIAYVRAQRGLVS